MNQCIRCSMPVELKRVQYGYATCLSCGDKLASRVRHTVVPMHKSNYVVASSLSMLKQLNPKRSGDDYE
jgi:DNA-directed RNA polymerase subunit RPC12/RpoP